MNSSPKIEPTTLENIREKDRIREIQLFLQVATSFLALPLFLIFWLADLVYAPELKWHFLGIRVSIIPTCLVINYLVRRVTTVKQAQIIGTCFSILTSAMITSMIFLSEGLKSPYYAGLNLITIGMVSFLPFTKKYMILNILVIYGPYLVSMGYYFTEFEILKVFIIHFFFILGTIVIALTNRKFTEKLKRDEVTNKFLLQNELTLRERIIEEKTREGLKLQTLTKQFSPQVVHAIVSGKLNVIETVHRSNICAIFIDIVNSTERILRIDKDDVNKVISLFMEDTMRVLLKYDITIDKFLGDGVLAFSNDPIKHHDYIERVVHAALEIRERIKKNEELYVEHWLNELQITVGIASGYADVGFYGSDSSFKAYTAIGRVINLASRLCSIAEPSQILVSQDVAKQISASRFSVTRLGSKKLKGFEADIINVFEVQNYSEELPIDTNIRECPNGHGVLHLDVNMDGIYVFKCRICGFEMSSAA